MPPLRSDRQQATVDALPLADSGAMLQASLGYLPFAEVVDRLAALAEALTRA